MFAMFFVTGLSASRTLMARISPPEMVTQFFGLFALSSTVTAFLAPLLVATVTDQFGWVTSCDIANPLDPNLLLNTTVQAELECNFSPSCGPWIDALATLTDVHLVLDAQIVDVDLTAWGAVKALYR